MVILVTWNKNNDQIGINFGHYHQVANMDMFKDKSKADKKLILMRIGADDEFSKDQIEEIINTY